ncbi:F-box only protein 42-like [Corvus kubaryi]|uniref:F-box only protein 42-like n=1 Tax=Corvus kubaryi TaxID=68294 RepID=UPI001C05DB3B|nr:F-box only protein 42-like [Corvus kubaryi]
MGTTSATHAWDLGSMGRGEVPAAVTWNAMASSSDSDDDGFMAVDPEDAVLEGTMEQEDEPHAKLEPEEPRHNRSMLELPEEVLEYILSFLSPYQEHKTAALVCKQWYRLIKGVAHQCYHGFIKAVQEGNIQWESRTYPYPGTPITQRFSHSEYPLGILAGAASLGVWQCPTRPSPPVFTPRLCQHLAQEQGFGSCWSWWAR